ncbi:MAG: hypothetical protein H7226_11510 [Salinibacterium sp.]|nr:hypothetical protein [Salinibacterium sp.]
MPDAEVDTSLWGPQSTEMKQMLMWASSYYFAVPYDNRDEARNEAWQRIEVALETNGRSAGVAQARTLMRAISTNDFFDHTGVEAIQALGARDLLSPEDYDTFTLPWRSKVGRIHPDDPEVPRDRRIDSNALWSKMSPEPK